MTDEERRELNEVRAALHGLRAQLDAAEARLRRLETAEPAPAPPASEDAAGGVLPADAVAEPSRQRRSRQRPPPRSGPRPPREPAPLERHIRAFLSEVNPLSIFGVLMLLGGVSILFKYAVDNAWIGPAAQVLIGMGAGAGFLAAGEYYQRKDWPRFAPVLVGAGQGLLFLAVYFGQQQYHIIPAPFAFALYVLFTTVVAMQSVRYDAIGLALWGLVGGYLTPVLASTGSAHFVFVSTYLLVLNAGVFALAYARGWQPLRWMAFLLTEPYLLVWVITYLNTPHGTRWLELHWLLPYLAAFFVYFAVMSAWRSVVRRTPMDRAEAALTVLNGAVHFWYAWVLLGRQHERELGGAALAVAALYLAGTVLLGRREERDTRATSVCAGMAAAFLLLATPFLVDGPYITILWCTEAVLLAWIAALPRFAVLQYHVVVALGLVLLRLITDDRLFAPGWMHTGEAYIPFSHLRSYPPLAAVIAFGLVGRLLGRASVSRIRLGWILVPGVIVLIAAVDGEAYRTAAGMLAPGAPRALRELVQAGLLVSVMGALWVSALRPLARGAVPWRALLGCAALLTVWVAEVLFWPTSYGGMTRILEPEVGLWWLHVGVLLLIPLLLFYWWLMRTAPDEAFGQNRAQLRIACFAAAVIITMFLLRREIFAVTHAPPLRGLFPLDARRASYRMLLSLSYAALAFGIYLRAVWKDERPRLYVAYALYVFTAVKVILLDIESSNQLYRGFSVVLVGIILMLSHYFAERQRTRLTP